VLLLVGVYVVYRFPIGCLFVPCDRSVEFILEPRNQDLKGCDLVFFEPDDKNLSEPVRALDH